MPGAPARERPRAGADRRRDRIADRARGQPPAGDALEGRDRGAPRVGSTRMHQADTIRSPMKWWGWGDESVSFTHEGKPELAPFIERVLELDVRRPGTPAMAFEDLEVPAPALPAGLRAELEAAVGSDHVSTGDHERVMHGRGKSLTDLMRQRRGDLGRLPDVVVRPADEDQVIALMRAALEADAVVIPFGGGSSISGSLEPEPGETRPVISVDMARMNRVLSLDATSQLARVQTGVIGPDLERQLNAQGWTCGHFPDSFTYSTLGGWIATRSSGMQSDRYGDVAELTRGLRVVTPSGLLVVRPVPSTSTGPSVREMVLGSEGRLGIITEATIHVQRIPPERKILGYLFPSWADGLAAMRDIEAMCLSFIGYEGSAADVAAQRKQTERIAKRHGGLCIGSSPGALYDQKKVRTPYKRDFLPHPGAPAD